MEVLVKKDVKLMADMASLERSDRLNTQHNSSSTGTAEEITAHVVEHGDSEMR